MKKLPLLVTAVLLALVLSGCSFLYPNMGKPTDSPSPSKTHTKTPTSNPTDTQTSTPTPTDKAAANVEILDAYADTANGVIQVIAQVTNFSEDGGTCTATFTSGSKTVKVSQPAESNAANTQCHPLEINLGGLPAGVGTITVTYESKKYYGVSAPSSVTI
jgi:PBP1b-binding outer membrane lipoprotein LpoB